MRDYVAMRDVLGLIAGAGRPVVFNDFAGIQQRDMVVTELQRLSAEGLVDSTLEFEGQICHSGKVSGLTADGAEFYRLIENDGVWGFVLATLRKAGVDLSYPLLKEVCEEVVKRYVASFIPDIGPGK